jgi:hypothetical protein
MDRLEYILMERDTADDSGNIFLEYASELTALSTQKNFIQQIINSILENTISAFNIKRFEFITFLLISLGNNSSSYQIIYMRMIDFILDLFARNDISHNDKENLLEIILDLFWHQDNGFRDLDVNEQIKLKQLLEIAATHKYEITKNGAAIFFAINKSMDLIKFQNSHGNSEHLINLYLNHFDNNVRERAIKYKENNWL